MKVLSFVMLANGAGLAYGGGACESTCYHRFEMRAEAYKYETQHQLHHQFKPKTVIDQRDECEVSCETNGVPTPVPWPFNVEMCRGNCGKYHGDFWYSVDEKKSCQENCAKTCPVSMSAYERGDGFNIDSCEEPCKYHHENYHRAGDNYEPVEGGRDNCLANCAAKECAPQTCDARLAHKIQELKAKEEELEELKNRLTNKVSDLTAATTCMAQTPNYKPNDSQPGQRCDPVNCLEWKCKAEASDVPDWCSCYDADLIEDYEKAGCGVDSDDYPCRCEKCENPLNGWNFH